jgi:hypothetical protein
MWKRNRGWLLRRVVLGFAIVAVAAPVAQARIDEGALVEKGVLTQNDGQLIQGLKDRSVALNEKFVQGTDSIVALNEKFVQGGPSYSLHPVGAPWTVESPTRLVQVPHDRPIVVPPSSEPVAVVSKPDGFDWGDAGIGAGALFGLMLLGAGALRVTRHVGQPTTA